MQWECIICMAPPLDIAYHVSSRRRGTGREYQVRRPEQRCCVFSTLIIWGTQGPGISYFLSHYLENIMILSVKHWEYQIRRPEQRCCVSSTLIVSGTQGLRILYFMFSQYFKPNIGNIWSDDQNNVVYLQLLSPRTQISHKLSFSISGGSLFLSVMMPGPLG